MRWLFLVTALVAGWTFTSCNEAPEIKTDEGKLNKNHAHWGYQGAESPEHWAELSPEFIQCAEGHFQSPIDIETFATKKLDQGVLEFNYHPSPIDLVNNGHTIQAVVEEPNSIEINSTPFYLKQIHFHEPSEHHIDGVIYPMEMHMVHQSEDGKLAVLGIWIKEGPENQELVATWELLPKKIKEHKHPHGRCDMVHLLPDEKSIFHYRGSLTTPPCTEGVEWFLMEHPITLSKQQIAQFRKLYHGNNRPVQPTESRTVEALN